MAHSYQSLHLPSINSLSLTSPNPHKICLLYTHPSLFRYFKTRSLMAITVIFMVISTLLLPPATAWKTPTTPPPALAPAPPFVNLTDLLSLAGPFHTFLTYLTDTQVIQNFQNQANNIDQGITVFSPSDKAFASLTNPSLSNLTKDQLQSLLLFHAFPQFYTLTGLLKNLTGLSVATMAGAQFTLNITDSSGGVQIDSDWSHTSISSSVYSELPVAVYKVDQVLLPKAIFSSGPPQAPAPVALPLPPQARSPPSNLPPTNSSSPQPSETAIDKSSSYKTSFGAITCFVMVISSVLMLLL